jgi:hypothetical protein
MVVAAAAVAFFSIGVVAPAATAAESHSDAAYELTVGGQSTILTEGETVVYPMVPVTKPGQVTPNVVYPGDGTGTVTVTASGGVYHYDIAMHIPVTNFVGHFSITDLTSGLSGGSTLELVWAGSVPTSKLHGHRYSGHLSGNAFLAGIVVSTVGPNATLYTYP